MWQKLYDDLKSRNFMVIAVAMDSAEAARPFIEAAKPTYVSVIDRDHHVATLYNMVNVPEAVWIDEAGHIVRPAENAGWADGFRKRNRTTGEMPPEATALMVNSKQVYMDAVRVWVINGTSSRHALAGDAARRQLRPPSENIALAQAHFRLGRHLEVRGRPADAAKHFEAARRLHPQSWNIWRQTFIRNDQGFASGPEFWARVDALGDRAYYPPPNIEGMPK